MVIEDSYRQFIVIQLVDFHARSSASPSPGQVLATDRDRDSVVNKSRQVGLVSLMLVDRGDWVTQRMSRFQVPYSPLKHLFRNSLLDEQTLSNRGELNHLRDCNLIWFWAGVVREEEDWSSDPGIEQSPSDWRVEYCYYCVLISGGDKFQSSGGPPSLSIRWCVRRENIHLNSEIPFFTNHTFNWN